LTRPGLQPRMPSTMNGVRKPDLLGLIAIWEFITIVGAIAAIVTIPLIFEPISHLAGVWRAFAIFGIGLLLAVLLGYIVVAILAGIGLLRGRNWGRILSIAHSGASLLFLPIGTIIGVLVIIYLVKEPVAAYFTARQVSS
jgi:hypothetical protein